jgi:hypothetical protein
MTTEPKKRIKIGDGPHAGSYFEVRQGTMLLVIEEPTNPIALPPGLRATIRFGPLSTMYLNYFQRDADGTPVFNQVVNGPTPHDGLRPSDPELAARTIEMSVVSEEAMMRIELPSTPG